MSEERKTMSFISHTHWDREWYMSFERHRFHLVELMDSLLETLDTNPDFRSFHLDGQAIVLEDYLAVKPQMRKKLEKYIADGRIIIGPWYILQDEYLTSGESNVRNMLYGIRVCKEYGEPNMVGYFPDSFGNISQSPQILRGFGIDCAAFGRGVTATAADNKVSDDPNANKYGSEIIWRSPDGSEVVGATFLNWYNNASEIPEEHDAAIARLNQIRDNAARVANTPHLLMMNGCDHQPVQSNIGTILKNIQPDYPEELIHSNFKDYFEKIKPYKDSFGVFEGELDSEFTNGWWTLANTASARLYIKQYNHTAQDMLEKWAEPLSVASWFAADDEVRREYFFFAWKSLMQNHPHDSICGCSVDDVHSEMVTRFKKAIQISEELEREEKEHFNAQINTAALKADGTIVVFNPTGDDASEVVESFVDFNKDDKVTADELSLVDADGNVIAAAFTDQGDVFDYYLPKDRFRVPFHVHRFTVRFRAPAVPGLGYKVFGVVKKAVKLEALTHGDNFMENKFLRVDIAPNGSFTLTDKRSGEVYRNLNVYEETGDAGDEYVYRQTPDNTAILSDQLDANVTLCEADASHVTFSTFTALEVPAGIVSYTERVRSDRKVTITLHCFITLWADSPRVDIRNVIDNRAENHRIRALFPAEIGGKTHYADGQFDVLKRNTYPWSGWTNPSKPGRMVSFFGLCDEKRGLYVATKGLPEYEVLRNDDHTLALTLLRSIDQLGDWGVFPTPDAQCIGVYTDEYSVIPYAGEAGRSDAEREARSFALSPFHAFYEKVHDGKLPAEASLVRLSGRDIVVSACKMAEERDSVILRVYNAAFEPRKLTLDLEGRFAEVYRTNLNEDREESLGGGVISVEIPQKKIVTFELVR